MIQKSLFDTEMTWFTASGIRAQKPLMLRGRDIPKNWVGHSGLPYLLVVTYSYDVLDETGLPSNEQYLKVADFERECVDIVEAQRLGVLAFTRTYNGAIRYFFYVSDVDKAIDAMSTATANQYPVAFAATEDREWNEFKDFLIGLSRE